MKPHPSKVTAADPAPTLSSSCGSRWQHQSESRTLHGTVNRACDWVKVPAQWTASSPAVSPPGSAAPVTKKGGRNDRGPGPSLLYLWWQQPSSETFTTRPTVCSLCCVLLKDSGAPGAEPQRSRTGSPGRQSPERCKSSRTTNHEVVL